MGNGGVIGADNRASSVAAPGVWSIQDLYNARLSGDWPGVTIVDPGIVEFVMSNAVGGIQGTVFQDLNFVHPVGNAEGRFTANSATDIFTITTSGLPEGHLLSVDDEVFFEEATSGDLPPPILPGISYYIESVPTSTTFKVSETLGGPAVSIISNGTENADRKIFKRPGASDPKIDIEIFHYDAATFPSGLTITGDQQVGEDVDANFRLTCVVVDKNLTIDTGGTLRITNNKRRFGFLIASRENVQIGPGTWTIPMFQNATPPGPQQRGHPQYRRWRVSKEGPFANSFLVAGGAGGNGGPNGDPSRASGGGGGSGFGNSAGAGGSNPGPPFGLGVPGRGTAGGSGGDAGSPDARGGTGGGLPGANNTMRGYAFVVGQDVTLPGPGPTVRISTTGANGASSPGGSGGGGGGGATVYILHSGAYTNNGTIATSGGTGGTGFPSAGTPGGAGTVLTIPVSGV